MKRVHPGGQQNFQTYNWDFGLGHSERTRTPPGCWQASCFTPNRSGLGKQLWMRSWDMKFATALIAGVLLLAGGNSSRAAIRIADDRRGKIGTYIDRH